MPARWQPAITPQDTTDGHFTTRLRRAFSRVQATADSFSSGSDWSRIFNTRVLMSATRFEIGRDRFLMLSPLFVTQGIALNRWRPLVWMTAPNRVLIFPGSRQKQEPPSSPASGLILSWSSARSTRDAVLDPTVALDAVDAQASSSDQIAILVS
jgi:hypothetical protein